MPTAPPGKVAGEGASARPPASGDAARGVKANVGSGVDEDEGVPVALDDAVPVALDDGVPVWLPVPVALLEPVPVPLADPVPDLLGMTLGVPLPDALPDGLRRLATLRPRYVRRASTASVGVSPVPPVLPPPLPPPPLAASHSSTDSRSPLAYPLLGTSWLTLTYR